MRSIIMASMFSLGAGGQAGGGGSVQKMYLSFEFAFFLLPVQSDIPITRPFPFSSFAMLTLSPGEPSANSTLGILSPTLTERAAEEWKLEAGKAVRRRRPVQVASGRAEDRRVANMTN